jgi:ribose 5-phosphate isomerase B
MAIDRIAFGCDHAGVSLKETLKAVAADLSIEVIDLGCRTPEPADYPDFARAVCREVIEKRADAGVLICGSGIGMSIAANRFSGIRAALCSNVECASLSRKHNNANVLVMGARFMEERVAIKCLEVFLETDFEGGRHLNRIKKID